MNSKINKNERDDLYILLAEYFARYTDANQEYIFHQLVKIVDILADENDRFCNMPKGITYAFYIAGLITSIEDENDRQRAITFLEDPKMSFKKWREDF